MSWPGRVAATTGLAWPVVSHGAALAGRSEWMPAITAVCAAVIFAALAIGARGARGRIVFFVGIAAVLLALRFAPTLLLFAPPALINLALGAHFATTLFAGREPLIATYARRERGETLPPDLASYTRSLTWMWTVFFFASAAVGVALAAFAPLELWSLFSNIVSYALVAALFVGEWVWRRHRFAHYRHAPLIALVRNVVQYRPSPNR